MVPGPLLPSGARLNRPPFQPCSPEEPSVSIGGAGCSRQRLRKWIAGDRNDPRLASLPTQFVWVFTFGTPDPPALRLQPRRVHNPNLVEGIGFGRRPSSHSIDAKSVPFARYTLPPARGRQLVRAMRGLTPIVLASIAVLMGCATTTQEDKARLDAADNEKCISYGTTPGTPAYTDCRLKVEHQRAILASQPLPPPKFKDCPTQASGLACVSPSGGR
jgi:hypothetical protein